MLTFVFVLFFTFEWKLFWCKHTCTPIGCGLHVVKLKGVVSNTILGSIYMDAGHVQCRINTCTCMSQDDILSWFLRSPHFFRHMEINVGEIKLREILTIKLTLGKHCRLINQVNKMDGLNRIPGIMSQVTGVRSEV